ncbi:breast cancer type 2 susceptibility protein [Bombina bombina]|uniref:breast cancer type 2 susceptibility protein n=1 Tax=Bombina bombina TaxID=8345 RepID=UPI00235A60F0|nr:breast cancer type 2 susceptibility protein [Bombina bombina]
MAPTKYEQPSFFDLFKIHCSGTDLGPISLNWFEELSAEALPFEPRVCEDHEYPSDWLGENAIQTPKQKPSTYSQLESTPTIFKEEDLSSPLFRTPRIEVNKSPGTDKNTCHKLGRSPSVQPHLPNQVFSPSSRCLNESPALMKEIFKTPLRDKKYIPRTLQDEKSDIYGSLFCTPQLIRNQSSRCISESLGAVVDPEMSWSSSLATPPSPTVIIAKDNDPVSRPKSFDNRNAVIVQSLFSKCNNKTEKALSSEREAPNETNKTADVNPEHLVSIKNECAGEPSNILKAPWRQTVSKALKDEEICQTVENVLDGMEDVLSIFFTSDKNTGPRKVKNDSRVRRKDGMKSDVVLKTIEMIDQDNNSIPLENCSRSNKEKRNCLLKTIRSKETSCHNDWSQLNLNISQIGEIPLNEDVVTHNDINNVCKIPSESFTTVSSSSGQRLIATENPYLNELNESIKDQESAQENMFGRTNYMKDHESNKDITIHETGKQINADQGGEASGNIPQTEIPKKKIMLCSLKKQSKFVYLINNDEVDKNINENICVSSVHHLRSCEGPDKENNGQETLDSHTENCAQSEPNAEPKGKEESDQLCFSKMDGFLLSKENEELSRSESSQHSEVKPMEEDNGGKILSSIKRKVYATAALVAKKRQKVESVCEQHIKQCAEQDRYIVQISSAQYYHSSPIQTKQGVASFNMCVSSSKDVQPNFADRKREKLESLPSSSDDLHLQNNLLPNNALLIERIEKKTMSENSSDKLNETCLYNLNIVNLKAQTEPPEHLEAILSDTRCSEQVTNIDGLSEPQSHNSLSLAQNNTECADVIRKMNTSNSPIAHPEKMNRTFAGFKTASNKNIHVSEDNLKKGQNLFKELEAQKFDNENKMESKLNLLTSLDDSTPESNLKGFKTASNKQINVSASKLAKGRFLFKDIEDVNSQVLGDAKKCKVDQFDEFPNTLSNACLDNIMNKHRAQTDNSESENKGLKAKVKENSNVNNLNINKLNDTQINKSHQTNQISNHTLLTSNSAAATVKEPKIQGCSTKILSHLNEVLTESQIAEISELSAIIENAGSQLDFTQFIKASAGAANSDSRQHKPVFYEESQNLNNSDVWKDVDFNDSFAVGEEKTEDHEIDLSKITLNGSEKAEDKHYGNAESSTCNLVKSDFTDSVAKSLIDDKGFEGFSFASGKMVNITKEVFTKAVKLFNDLDDSSELNKYSVNCKKTQLSLAFTSKDVKNDKLESTKRNVTERDSLHYKNAQFQDKNAHLDYNVGGKSHKETLHINSSEIASDVGLSDVCSLLTGNPSSNMTSEKFATYEKLTSLTEHLETDKEELNHQNNPRMMPAKGFQTASGKNITFSESSLEKVRKMFADDCLENATESYNIKNINNHAHADQSRAISCSTPKSNLEQKQIQISDWHQKAIESDITFKDFSFSTARGKKVTVSEDSLARVRNRFTDEEPAHRQNKSKGNAKENVTNEIRVETCADTVLSLERRNKRSLNKMDTRETLGVNKCVASTPPLIFNTASGKNVAISHESLRKARQIFSEISNADVLDTACTTQPTSESFTETHADTLVSSEGRTKNILSKMDTRETLGVNKCVESTPLLTFSTASGKNVAISHESLQKARQIFSKIGNEDTLDTTCKAQPRLTGENCTETSEDNINSEGRKKENLNKLARETLGVKCVASVSSLTFSTASGKNLTISHESLQKARQMFSEISNEDTVDTACKAQTMPTSEDCTETSEDTIISSEGGTKNSLNKLARETLAVNKCVMSVPSLTFSTASGKNVAISHESLQKARQMFSEIGNEDTLDTACKAQTRPTSEDCTETSEVTIISSEGRRKKSLNELARENLGVNKSVASVSSLTFSTASGKNVAISHESLQKARQMFSEINNEDTVDTACKAQTKPSKILPNYPEHENEDSISSKSLPLCSSLKSSSFSFASASEKEAPANKTIVKPNRVSYTKRDSEDASNTLSLLQNDSVANLVKYDILPQQNVSIPKTVGFSTANGKAVQLSDESLKKAKKMFSEIDNIHFQPPEKQDQFDSKITVKERETKISVEGKLEFKKDTKLSNSEHPINKTNNMNTLGFSTAGGKQVSVSETALQKVKGLLHEFDSMENFKEDDVLSRKQLLFENSEFNSRPMTLEQASALHKTSTCKQYNKESSLIKELKKPVNLHPICHSPLYVCGRDSTPALKEMSGIPNTSKAKLHYTSHTPKNYFEIEAAESAKAFMDDDDLTDAGLFLAEAESYSNKTANIRIGKRLRSEDGTSRGEPQIKRQLLPEFDRATDSHLKPLVSSPDGMLKDRRKFLYKVALEPVTCDAESLFKRSPNVRTSTFSAPNKLHVKANIFQHSSSLKSEEVSAVAINQMSSSVQRSNKIPVAKKAANTFIPPFKKNPDTLPYNKTSQGPKPECDVANDSRKENEDNLTSDISEKNIDEPDFSQMITDLQCARDMQEMRIRKKQRQRIKQQSGSLYRLKTSSAARIPLQIAVQGIRPAKYSEKQLHMYGVVKTHIGVNSENAASFQFHCLDYFTKDHLLSGNGIQLADGGWLIPSDKGKAGKEEIYRAFCDTPGVDPKLISPEWVYNHYRWIVWKLVALEVAFPQVFASRCLTPERVLLQLKYRYDVEIDKSHRSAIKKIMERDDSPAKTLVLCLSKIISLGSGLSDSCNKKSESAEVKPASAIIEVTDGWYSIKALLDPALTALLRRGRLFIGQKIVVHGAELTGSDDACTPLEAPETIMLKISANSTRPACWFTKLGYFRDPRPFCLSLSSLFSDGGIVGCVDVVIQRIYPMQWMEKMVNGTYVFRSDRAEEKEAEKHSAKQQKNLEVLFAKIQAEFEQQEVFNNKKGPRRRSFNEQQIRALQDGADLYEAIQSESDPGYLESCLTTEQLRALHCHRQLLNEKKQAQIQAEFRKAIESSEQGPNGCIKRDVTPVWKMRIADYREQDKDTAYILNIWRPIPDVLTMLKEGCRFKMYHLATSQSKGKSETADVQFTATKKTCFQQMQPSQSIMKPIYHPREVIPFVGFREPSFKAPYSEVDVVGLVISTYKKPGTAPIVYLSDEAYNFVAIKFWTDLGQLGFEEITKPCTYIAISNLRWKSDCTSNIPTVYAGDLSLVCTNPKECHLQNAIQQLKNSIKCVQDFRNEAENKLRKVNSTEEQHTRADRGLDPHTPTWKSGYSRGKNCLTPVAFSEQKQRDPEYTPDQRTSHPDGSGEMELKICKKRKAMDFLSRIPSPPPVTPVRPLVSPALQKAFRPPRSCTIQKGLTEIKGSTENIKTTLSLRASNNVTNSEDGFVADEELAMINTQALMMGLETEKTITEEASKNGSRETKNNPPNESVLPTNGSQSKLLSVHPLRKKTQKGIEAPQMCNRKLRNRK